MSSERRSRLPLAVETLVAEWDVVHSLLRKRTPLPDTDSIKSSISQAEMDLRCRDEEIQCLYAQIISFENEKRLIERNRDGYKSLLAPIHMVPPEVLQEIFLSVCSQNHIKVGKNDSVRIPSAILSQVCSSWNDLVSSFPQLWSNIVIEVHNHDYSTNPEMILERLLMKSGSAPLSLDVYISYDSPSEAFQLLSILARHSNRWLNASFDIDPDILQRLVPTLRPIQGNLPLLEYLDLDLDPQGFGDPIELFKDAPQLRSVVLSGGTNPDAISLPWEQLRSLTLYYPNDRYAPLLRLSSKLKDLTLNIDECGATDGESHAQIVLDTESFSLSLDRPEDIDIIDNLTFPKLTSLTLCSGSLTRGSMFKVSPIRSLTSRSSCTLTSLTWNHVPVSLESFLSFLSTMPSIKNLSLSDWKFEENPVITDELFQRLQIQPSFSLVGVFLPNLQTLSLSTLAEKRCFSDASFVDAVKSRWFPNGGVAHCLRSARLETKKREFTEVNNMFLQKLARAGMKIVIRDESGIVLC